MTEEYLLTALAEAIQMEKEGRGFYLKAAALTARPEVRQTLEYLAEAEDLHIVKLQEILRSLQQDPAWTESLAAHEPLPRRPDLFTGPGPGSEEGSANDEETLRAVLAMEQAGIDHYTRLAREAGHPLARRFFASVAREEQGHYDTILDLLSFLVINF